MLFSALLYVMTVLFAKAAYNRNPGLTSFDVILFRSVVTVLLTLFASVVTGANAHRLAPGSFRFVAIRCSMGVLAIFATFKSVQMISISKNILISNLNPMFVMLFCFIFLKERITKYDVMTMCCSFTGVVFVSLKAEQNTTENSHWLGIVLAIVSSICGGAAHTATKKANQKLHHYTIPLYFALTSTLVCLLPIITLQYYRVYNFSSYDATTIIFMCMVGVGNTGGSILMSLALKLELGGRAAQARYAQIVFALIADWTIFHQSVIVTDVIGASLIIFSFIFIAWLKARGTVK